MAQKKITDLQLIDAILDGLSLIGDDTIQTYRMTTLQIKNYILANQSILLPMLKDDILNGLTLETPQLLDHLAIADSSDLNKTKKISLAALKNIIYPDPVDVEIYIDGGNGYGSTDTKIRRFTTVQKNTLGAYATYADTAANGTSITVHTPGLYSVYYSDFMNAAGVQSGISVNATSLTSGIMSLTYATGRRGIITTLSSTNYASNMNVVLRLNQDDVVRAHADLFALTGTDAKVIFHMIRIGD